MRLIKTLSLAAFAALAAMAFVGVSSASAQEHEVVICNKNEPLCANGQLKPAGASLTLLGKLEKLDPPPGEEVHAVLLGNVNELCAESHAKGTITSSIPLHGEITELTFKNCTPCSEVTVLNLPYLVSVLHLIGAGKHLWLAHVTPTIKGPIRVHFKGCPFGVTCEFGSSNILLDLENTAEGLPLILTLKPILERTGGSAFFCGNTGEWDANYLTEVLSSGVKQKGYLSLDKKA